MKKYYCCLEWNYRLDPPMDICTIGKVIKGYEKQCEEQDGLNFVGKDGDEGIQFDLCDSLEDAILKSNYRLEHINQIKFDHISIEEINIAMHNINKGVQ